MQAYLDGFDRYEKQYVIDGIRFGFNIQSSVPPRAESVYTNHKSALDASNQVTAKLLQEKELFRIAGPFDVRPPGLLLSPLASVPKRDSNDNRLIHDLSFPRGESVNDFIPREASCVVYELVDNCIDIVCEIGLGCEIAKADIKNAFRILPVHPDCYNLLGFQWLGQFYFDKCIVMGCSSSCQIFEKLSGALQWILINKFDVSMVSHILDDFMFFGAPGSRQANKGLQSFMLLCSSVGIEIKHQKTVFPTTRAELHGLLFDTVKMEVSLPKDKLDRALELVNSMYNRKFTTLRDLQSLLGLLNFCTKVVVPGRTVLRRLIDLTKGVTCPTHHIRLNNEARADLACWRQFLHNFNGVKLLKKPTWKSSNTFKLFSDASFKACAAIFGHHWLQVKFPESWKEVHIAAKELLPVMLAFKLWAVQLKGYNVLFLVDNISIVHVLNNKTSKDPIIMKMMRQMVIHAMSNHIDFGSTHIVGKLNTLPDMLSRLQEDKAKQVAPWLDQNPTQIPEEWLPW